MPAIRQLRLGYVPATGTVAPFDEHYKDSINLLHYSTSTIPWDTLDAVVLWGGEDIASSYYGQAPHPLNQNHSGDPSYRDKVEWAILCEAKARSIPIIGVCRGAQMLCAFSGGQLYQHVTGHGSSHTVITRDDEYGIMETSSCHHQMMVHQGSIGRLLAWSAPSRSDKCEMMEDGHIATFHPTNEPEMIWYPSTKGLAIQGHPEWMNRNDPYVQYCNDMIRKYVVAASPLIGKTPKNRLIINARPVAA